MATHYLKFPGKPLILEKFKNNPKNPTLKSFWAFILSVFAYISAFYIFNLSPSAVFSTTKFWFFISNTLILIIAADFGQFTLSKEPEFYQEYEKTIGKTIAYDHKEEANQNPQEKIINIVVATSDKPQIIEENDDQRENPEGKMEKKEQETVISVLEAGTEQKKRKAKCERSNSDKAVIMAAVAAEESEGKRALRRTLSEGQEEPPRSEENEFSSMSDEELNRRVEEFIRRFNRQIRLQAARSRQDLPV